MSSQNPTERETENTWENLDEGVRRAVICLRDFARKKEKDFQYVISLSPSELGVFLKDFYLQLRNQAEEDGTASVASLQRVRADLSEYFKKAIDVDITVGNDFTDCNGIIDENLVKDTGVKNTVMKKHSRQRTFTFETNELRQIYLSDAMNLDQPESLQNKVFFDVCMYICNRGKDFLRLMTKNDFEVSTDQNGRRYVWLKFNSKFSFSEVAGGTTTESVKGSQIGERMYERPGDPKCPVLSYTQYVIHLHPMSDAFWQRPKRSVLPTDFVWYDNQSIGNSTLNKLMNRITQSAGLPDSYAINAIKSSYIPIIESICRYALFGKSKTLFHIATRGSSWDSGSPHMFMGKAAERLDTTQEAGYQTYRNCDSDIPGYQAKYRDTGQNGGQDLQSHAKCAATNMPQVDEDRKKTETGSILEAKLKCLDIVHSLEVRDIKSFINWMKTFEVKHESSGLMVTCQPVNDMQQQQQIARSMEQNGINGYAENGGRETVQQRNNSGLSVVNEQREFEAKDLEFDCIGDTFCCTSDISPMKITIPAQDTVILTGLQAESQLLLHKNKTENKSIDQKYSPLHLRVFTSNENYSLQNVKSVALKKISSDVQANENNIQQDTIRSSFKEEKSIPMKKRIVVDQGEQSQCSSMSSSPQSYPQSRSPPTTFPSPRHSSPLTYMPQQQQGFSQNVGRPPGLVSGQHSILSQASSFSVTPGPLMSASPGHGQPQGPSQQVSAVPKYRERFPDGWGYIPLQKRQKFGMHTNNSKEDAPLDLIKQT
ncbi:uncharacterized protein LOC123551310 [Mercenaria mercenaria]|uniref:uncharacterized protein LOC123551310 n=1 Tax=Mercenaria mercenaria TaxID=6596 RepID=UPI00234ED0E4|nr:uncharacterized protein LOC123551310 [Mercenaria mercenaria]